MVIPYEAKLDPEGVGDVGPRPVRGDGGQTQRACERRAGAIAVAQPASSGIGAHEPGIECEVHGDGADLD